jgi:septin family protein
MDQVGKSTKNELTIIVVGNSGTGKTSFVNKWILSSFWVLFLFSFFPSLCPGNILI